MDEHINHSRDRTNELGQVHSCGAISDARTRVVVISSVGRFDSPNHNGIASFGGVDSTGHEFFPPLKAPFELVGITQKTNVRRLWQLETQSKDGRHS